ncbi:MAG: lysine--tRNA ligase [Nitrospirae bacterium]|nr:MAG: lysine--tRNA ligase [Nitrospirota bacterium]
MEPENELIQQRKRKLEELRELGIDPYGGVFDKTHSASDIFRQYGEIEAEALEKDPVEVTVAGRIVAWRSFGKAAFSHIQDSTGKIQVYFRKDILGDRFKIVKKFDIGDIIGVRGKLFRTKTGELTILVEDFSFLTKSLRPLPEKWHGLKDIELRYRQRYVDLIVNPEVRQTFLKRCEIIRFIRDYLEREGFIEVETPMMHQIPGGATARPFKTHHNALGIDLYLRIAPELYLKRLLVGGFERVFELNKNFRNEGISTKHNPEFTMLEFYVAYRDYNFLMDFTERMFTELLKKTVGSMKVKFGDFEIDFTPPWPRIPMYEALKKQGVPEEIFSDYERARKWAISEGIDVKDAPTLAKLLDEIFKEKVEPHLIQPTFIIDYPVELSPLAKRKRDNPELVERFELFIAQREIANAFTELNDPEDQRQRFLKQVEAKNKGDEEAHWMDEDFVRALEYGMPPAAGEGIGIDRLVMILTGSTSIRDVILFPQMKPEKKQS